MNAARVIQRNNVRVVGRADGPALVLVQGFGCDQVIWDRVLPWFTDTYKVVLLDHVGTGGADPQAYDPDKYAALSAYQADLEEVLEALDLRDATILGHSIAGSMALASAADNPRIGRLVLVCTSARYLNDEGYGGGFEPADIDGVLAAVQANYPLWAAAMAPGIVGEAPGSALSAELAERMCRLRPEYVVDFLRMSFRADVRDLLPRVRVPVLILQAPADPLTPEPASRYLHEHLPSSSLMLLEAPGNMPHVHSPQKTAEAVLAYLSAAAHG